MSERTFMKYWISCIIFILIGLFFVGKCKAQQVFHETVKAHAHFKAEDRYTYQKDSLQHYEPAAGNVFIIPSRGVLTINSQRYILLAGVFQSSPDCDYILKQYTALGPNRDTCSVIFKVFSKPTDCQLLIVIITKEDYDFYKMDDAEMEEQ